MNPTQTHTYSPEAFDDVSTRIPRIRAVAQALGIHPEAIYGALVEENHDYRQGWLKNALGDAWALSQSRDHAAMARDYQHAGQQGKLDEHDTWDKLNPVLNDVGPYNIQLGTAIRLLHAYIESTPSGQDPLNLRRFRDDYPALASGLAEGEVAPEFAGLMLKEAYQYMATHADPGYWSPLPPAQQDAIAITYYNMGRTKIEKRRPDNMQEHGGKYLPQPGEEAAAGKNHLANAETIGGLFGNPNYHYPASPSSPEPTARRPPPSTSSTYTRPTAFRSRAAAHCPISWRARTRAAIRLPWTICVWPMACYPTRIAAFQRACACWSRNARWRVS
jgi:hypothetical protein